jgi:hypothetical protein
VTATKAARREVRYASLEEVVTDAERLTASGTATLGEWSAGQIFEHLAATVEHSIDGFGFRSPWFVRLLGKVFLKRKILRDGMRPGFRLPKNAASLLPPPTDAQVGLDHLRHAVERFRRETSRAPHPVFDTLTPEEWDLLHRRHCELHMSFLAEG